VKRLAHIILLLMSITLPFQAVADYAPCLFQHGGGDPSSMMQMHPDGKMDHSCCPDDHASGDTQCHCHSPGHVPGIPFIVPAVAVAPAHEAFAFVQPAWVSLNYPPVTPPDIA